MTSLNKLLGHCEEQFAFLTGSGFQLTSRKEPQSDSFKEGWALEYTSPAVRVSVEYYDSQFNVFFTHQGVTVSYLFIDTELYGRRSGYHGDMFPRTALSSAISQVAADVRVTYSTILHGDRVVWEKLTKMAAAPSLKRKLP